MVRAAKKVECKCGRRSHHPKMNKQMKTTHVRGRAAGRNWNVILALTTAAILHASGLNAADSIADRDAVWHGLDKHFKSLAQLELAFLEYWLQPDDSPTNPATNVGSPAIGVSADLHWTASKPLIGPVDRDGDHYFADKDPSFVQHAGRWHLFCTVRGRKRSHQIEYLSFPDWEHVEQAERHMLPLTDNYCCAPSVFYFRPQKKWYLIFQYSDSSQDRSRKPGFSTNADIGKWQDWTKPAPLFAEPGQLVKDWIDFWVICDEAKAYLFFTSDDGRMWRSDTKLDDFPHGWSKPALILQADIFEASHTYRLHGRQQYLTIIEAIGPNGRRYYKSYSAETLDGKWEPEAATWERPFAGLRNVTSAGRHWADSISHGELFRLGTDERMEVDPANLRLLFQGVSDEQMRDKPYGEIPWRLGILDFAGAK
jgi:Glycosyl hydrolase family 62